MKPGGRKIWRWLFNAAALLSLLLAIAVAGLWVRSVWVAGDELVLGASKTRHFGFGTRGGRLEFATDSFDDETSLFPTPSGITHRQYPATPTEWLPLGTTRSFSFVFSVSVSDGLLLLVFAILPAAWLVKARYGRPLPGCCTACGYDLRASKYRCPECGEAIQRELPPPRENYL